MLYEPDDPARFSEYSETAEFEGGSMDQLFTLVYDELRRNARRRLRRERLNHTLQTTALVHEAYIKLAGQISKPLLTVMYRSGRFGLT